MRTFIVTVIVTLATFVVHEFAHFFAALGQGCGAILRINSVTPVCDLSPFGAIVVAGAGPAVTFIQGLFGFLMRSRFGFDLLVVAAIHRTMAGVISVIGAPNDEVRISIDLGLPPWALSLAVCTVLWALVLGRANTIRPGWSYAFWAWLGSTVAISAVVLGEPYLPEFVVNQ